MLGFLRKYQRFFYLVITVVIIVSFSFFGTYSTLGQDSYHEQVAFTAVDGTPVNRGDLEQLVTFIGTDARDKLVLGGIWGPNFLNDGVIRNDFLKTGLAQQLVKPYLSDLSNQLETRLEKEKRNSLYSHPQIPTIGVEGIWTYISPEAKKQYHVLRSQSSGSTPQAFDARVQLYLTSDQLPAPALHQILRQQQRQYGLQPDSNLDYIDLSLFNYHSLDDWFGSRFLRLMGEFIMNSAIIAEQRGYKVTKEEALADLLHNSEMSYRDHVANANVAVANSSEYFNEQLHRLSLDQNKAVKIWRQVLLSRRLFHDVGQAIFIDPQSLQPFQTYAKTAVEGSLYNLAPEFHFNNEKSLKLFETYLQAISQRPTDGKQLLKLPHKINPIAEIQKNAPELVQKRYLLDISQTNKSLLQARVSLKDTWDWELDDKNWEILKNKYPEINAAKATTRDERMSFLDSINEAKRMEIDSFARQAIVDNHPEWLEKALEVADLKRISLILPYKGGSNPFIGLKNSQELLPLLDKSEVGNLSPALASFSADNKNFYKIVVIDRSPEAEVATFAEALETGALDDLMANKREIDLAPLHQAIYQAYVSGITPEKAPAQLLPEVSASLRFFSYLQDILTQLKENPQSEQKWLRTESAERSDANLLPPREALVNQWKLIRTPYSQERDEASDKFSTSDLFTMQPGSWSPLQTPISGDLQFFQLINKSNHSSTASLEQQIQKSRELLSDEAQVQLMKQLLEEIEAKKAISLEFMNVREKEEIEPEAG